MHEAPEHGSVLITNATLVLEDQVVPHGAVAIVDGVIAEVGPAERLCANGLPTIDAHGALCLPGLVNIHDDEIETEMNPRPQTMLPRRFARANYLTRALASGVATTFYALVFGDMETRSYTRSLAGSTELADEVFASSRWRGVDQYVLYRVRTDAPACLEATFEHMRGARTRALNLLGPAWHWRQEEPPPADPAVLFPTASGCAHLLDEYFRPDRRARLEALVSADPAELDEAECIAWVLGRIALEHERAPLLIYSHDDDTPEKVDLMAAMGARFCEMPVEVAAAVRARERGLIVSVGAPNIARGGSTRGKVAATELVARGLANVIVADYHTQSLLYAAFELARLGLRELPEAVAMASAAPADAIGLSDRGRLAPGRKGDASIVHLRDGLPTVEAIFTDGRARYATRELPAGAAAPPSVAPSS